MPHAHDGVRQHSIATARAGDGTFLFLSRPATDFADTGGIGPYEALTRPVDLDRWAMAATGTVVTATGADLAAARSLRAAIWQLSSAMIAGKSFPGNGIDVLNRVAAAPDPVPVLNPGGVGWAGQPVPAAILSWVARDAIRLFGTEEPSRLRQCAGVNCALLFYDDSRSGARRWCAPQRCGDRTRSREYRRRHTDAPTEPE